MFKNTFVLRLGSSYSLFILAVDSEVFIGDLIKSRTAAYDLIPPRSGPLATVCRGTVF
jgi:hypothetical protein